MSIRIKNMNPNNIGKWFAASGGVKANQLIKSNSGAAPVAAAHTGQTLLGISLEAQATQNAEVLFYPLLGTVLEIPFYASATKQSLAITDCGTQYDMHVASDGDMSVDLDDTTGGYLILIGYDNAKKVGYFTVDIQDILVAM